MFFGIEDNSVLLEIHNYSPGLYTKQSKNFSNQGLWEKSIMILNFQYRLEPLSGGSTDYAWSCTGRAGWSYFENEHSVVRQEGFVQILSQNCALGCKFGRSVVR